MATASVNVDRSAIARLLRLPGGIVDRDLRRRANRVLNVARAAAPGGMKDALSVELEGTGTGRRARIVLNHHAALFVTQGTRPHPILPRIGGALRFRVNGRLVYVKWPNYVRHPGNKPNDFLNKALREAVR